MSAAPLSVFIDDAPLTFRILGGSAVTRGGETLIGPGKAVALLTCTACAPRDTAGHDHLIDLLWTYLYSERACHVLRITRLKPPPVCY